MTVDKAHGRLEKRTLRVTTILTLHQKWPGLAQGFELTRERREKGATTVEVVHGITSLKPEKAGAKRLLELTRAHWAIENQLHYVRDVTLGEDACRVRRGVAPQVLAALRIVVVHLLS
jgi:predicted transposase YbfD/YdcC